MDSAREWPLPADVRCLRGEEPEAESSSALNLADV